MKIREILYLLVKLSVASVDEAKAGQVDLAVFFSTDSHTLQVPKLVDFKFKDAVKQGVLFSGDTMTKNEEFLSFFERLEKIEPHAIYPTSIYRQSDGCTVATEDSQKIEAVMSTTLSSSIRISSHVLGFDNQHLAEIYRPLGRVVVVLDDKLDDQDYTSGRVEMSTNRRLVPGMEKKEDDDYALMTIREQLERYCEFHNIECKVILKSGNEADKDIENVQQVLIDMKRLGVMRNEPVLVIGGVSVLKICGGHSSTLLSSFHHYLYRVSLRISPDLRARCFTVTRLM